VTINGINFVCTGRDEVEIPLEVLNSGEFRFPDLHSSSEEMAKLAKAIKLNKHNSICVLPFCLTVETEALGARVNLGNTGAGPRISSYSYESIEQLADLKMMDFNSGRIKSVLAAVETLAQNGEIVTLNVCGPFTIISSLVNPVVFYKAIRKNRKVVDEVLELISDNIFHYIRESIKRGAQIVSYADSLGSADIVGPLVYKDCSADASLKVLKKLQAQGVLKESLLHICGKTSVSLEKHGFVKSFPIKLDPAKTYGESIIDLLPSRNAARIIGHNCIKRTPYRLKNPVIWGIDI